MKNTAYILLALMLLLTGCVTEFIPQITEEEEMLVVEGLITDRLGKNTIKLSKSMPLGVRSDARPLGGCFVSIKDDFGNFTWLKESVPGTYVTDSLLFRGIVGRFYTLHISVPEGSRMINYESFPVEMKPVPPIDGLYYQKTVISERTNASITGGSFLKHGCSDLISMCQTRLAGYRINPKTSILKTLLLSERTGSADVR